MTVGRIPSVEGGIQPTLLTAKGDLISATAASTVARLAVGSDAQILVADSSTATGLKWATASGGGKVLQVVNATYATQTSTSSNTFSDTGITATITPSSATSKVMVIVSFAFGKSDQNANSRGNLKFLRDATTVGGGQTSFLRTSSATFQTIQYATSFVDSPASTSALVYKVQFSSLSSLAAITICEDNNQANIQLLEIGA